jgi:hypothetical protein
MWFVSHAETLTDETTLLSVCRYGSWPARELVNSLRPSLWTQQGPSHNGDSNGASPQSPQGRAIGQNQVCTVGHPGGGRVLGIRAQSAGTAEELKGAYCKDQDGPVADRKLYIKFQDKKARKLTKKRVSIAQCAVHGFDQIMMLTGELARDTSPFETQAGGAIDSYPGEQEGSTLKKHVYTVL